MTTPMQPRGNPSTAEIAADRFGQPIGRPFKSYLGGKLIDDAMTPPATRAHCVYLGTARRAEFVVIAPDSVTAYTIHYGRWVDTPDTHGNGTGFSGFLEMGTRAVTGSTPTTPVSVEFETHTDAVGIYVDTLTGTVDAEETFQIWSRGLPSSGS